MYSFLKIFIIVVLALALLDWLGPNGNLRIYFPIVTAIVLSVLFTLILRFIGTTILISPERNAQLDVALGILVFARRSRSATWPDDF